MSDFYGDSTLEDWLAEEVFCVKFIPREVVDLFEKWRIGIENNIESWMETDDGYGNKLSWRGWGRGFDAIPENELEEFEMVCQRGKEILKG